MIHFNLNFGSALGGGASAGLVRMWLDPFLRDTLTSLIVWPNRMVFPILPESPANNLEELTIKFVSAALSIACQRHGSCFRAVFRRRTWAFLFTADGVDSFEWMRLAGLPVEPAITGCQQASRLVAARG